MKSKIEKNRNYGTMTESQYFSKIRSGLRQTFRWWKPLAISLNNNSRPYIGLNKRIKKEYRCNSCNNWFQRKEVEVDHIVECGSLSCYEDIVPFIKRLTVEDVSLLQVLCKKCHKNKTNESRTIKKENNVQLQKSLSN
jgi:hypothetical protein